MWVMTPGPCSSSSTWVWPGATRKLSQLLCFIQVAARLGLGIELLFRLRGAPHRRAWWRWRAWSGLLEVWQGHPKGRPGPKPAFPGRAEAGVFVSYRAWRRRRCRIDFTSPGFLPNEGAASTLYYAGAPAKVAGMPRRPGYGLRRQAKRDAAFPNGAYFRAHHLAAPEPKRRRASLAAAVQSNVGGGLVHSR